MLAAGFGGVAFHHAIPDGWSVECARPAVVYREQWLRGGPWGARRPSIPSLHQQQVAGGATAQPHPNRRCSSGGEQELPAGGVTIRRRGGGIAVARAAADANNRDGRPRVAAALRGAASGGAGWPALTQARWTGWGVWMGRERGEAGGRRGGTRHAASHRRRPIAWVTNTPPPPIAWRIDPSCPSLVCLPACCPPWCDGNASRPHSE